MQTTANTAGGELRGKAAIVTGSTSGIGLGIADAFTKAGMNAVLNGFGEAGASRLRSTASPSTRDAQATC